MIIIYMEKNIKYKQKYLKYKQKYLLEKNQLYGGSTAATTVAIHNFQQQLANQKNIIDAGRAQASNPRVDSIFQQLETDVISTLDNFKQTLNVMQCVGISLIVAKFTVISSPSLPSPLDNPLSKLPFL